MPDCERFLTPPYCEERAELVLISFGISKFMLSTDVIVIFGTF